MEIKELANPRFLKWLLATQPVPIEPDDEDIEFLRPDSTDEVLLESYRAAGVSKLVRLYRKWLASQN